MIAMMGDLEDVLTALKRSSKGRLSYDRNWKEERRTQEIISEVKLNTSAITISPKCLTNGSVHKSKSCAKYKVIESSNDGTKDTNSGPKCHTNGHNMDGVDNSGRKSSAFRLNESIDGLDLRNYEKQRQESVSEELSKRIKCLETEFRKCNEEFDEEFRLIRQKYALDAIKRINGFEDDYKALKDSISFKLMTSEDDSLTTSTKLKEIESKHQLLVEEQQRKQLDFRRKQLLVVRNEMDLVVKSVEQLCNNWETVIKSDQFFHTLKQELNLMKGLLQSIDMLSTKPDLSDLDVSSAQNLKLEVIRIKERLVADIERLRHSTQEPLELRSNAQNPSVIEATDPIPINTIESQSMSGSVDNKAFKEYLNLQKYSNEFENSFQSFVSETKFKQKRNELQLFVKTTINTISCESVEHIKDKLNRLTQLFSEKSVESGGKQINCSAKDGSLNFCISLASKMFVSVSTKQKDISLTMAPIVVFLWQRFPTFGQIFMAHMHDKCPYLVPYYPKRDAEDTDDNETKYLIACGYTISKDGTVEPEDSFINRMRAMIKLYSAIIQCNLQDNHPHGLRYAWIWISRTLNLEPRPVITAAILESFISISCHKLYRFYGKQFIKIIHFITNDYMKRIENVTQKDTKRQSLVKLQMTVEDIKKKMNRNVDHKVLAPEGLIPDYFFQNSYNHSRGTAFHFNN